MSKKARKLIRLDPEVYKDLVRLQEKRTQPGWPKPSIAFLANNLLAGALNPK